MDIQKIIWEQTIVEWLHGGSVQRRFEVEEWARLKVLFVIDSADVLIDCVATGVASSTEMTCLILSKNKEHVAVTVNGHLQANDSHINIHLLSFLGEQADANVDGGIIIAPWVTKVAGHLLEESVVLGKKIKIKTLPRLDVHSADVSASHGAKIDRLDETKLFYMMARGLDQKQSQKLIVEGYLQRAADNVGLEEASEERVKIVSGILDYLDMKSQWEFFDKKG